MYNNKTITNASVFVSSDLTGITYLELNSAGGQAQIVDLQGRSQLTQTSLILFEVDALLSSELKEKSSSPTMSTMTDNMF